MPAEEHAVTACSPDTLGLLCLPKASFQASNSAHTDQHCCETEGLHCSDLYIQP